MWNDLERPWQAAFELGWEAFCNDCIPIGAVIVDPRGNILSRGRNRTGDGNVLHPKIAHAETEALQSLDTSRYPDVGRYTLFTGMEPCPMCMGTIVMSALRKVRIAARDRYCGATHYCNMDPYVSSKQLEISFAPEPLEAVHLFLQSYHAWKTTGGQEDRVIAAFRKDRPAAVESAKALYDESGLDRWMEAGIPFGEVFDRILERVASE